MQIIKFKDSMADLPEQKAFYQELDERFIPVTDTFDAPDWVIKGIIPEGVGVISGAGGVGKTTSIVPLALIAAGIKSESCNLDVEIPRRVIYITEDPKQVMTILKGMRKFLNWNEDEWRHLKDQFKVVDSRRMGFNEVQFVLDQSTFWGTVVADNKFVVMPLVIFDTASSNFDISNENDNSEVSAFMSLIKEFHYKFKSSIWIIAHLSKTAKGQAVDDILNHGARGAGAWDDNSQWTATLAAAEENNQGHRVLKLGKRRETLAFDEIQFEGSLQHETVTNRLGEEVQIDYRYTVPRKSSADQRISEKLEKRNTEIEDAVFKALEVLEYPSKRDILGLVKFNRNVVMDTINQMILTVTLKEMDLPKNVVRKGRSTYIGVPNNEF